jgi:hypothetical protein
MAPEFIKKYCPDIEWTSEQFGGLSSADLELLSTIVYVDREFANGKLKQAADKLVDRVREIKPHFKKPYVENKVSFLDQQHLLKSLKPNSLLR